MKFLREFIIINDTFGSENKFNLNGRKKFQTLLGGLLNFAILFIFFYKFFNSFIKFLNGEGPKLNLSEDFDTNSIEFKPGEDIISIYAMTNLEDEYTYYDLEKYFFIESYVGVFNNSNGTYVTLDHEKNSTDYNSINIYASENGGNNLTGSLSTIAKTEIETKIFWIDLNFCKSDSNYTDCKDPNLFRELLENSSLNAFIITVNKKIFDSENYKIPFKEQQEEIYSLNSINILKTINIEMENIEVESETISMLDVSNTIKNKTTSSYSMDYIYSNEFDKNKKSFKNNYLSIMITQKPTKRKYIRKYPFIDELIGDATLLTSWISIFFGFFYRFYNEQLHKEFLFKRLINFNEQKINLRNISINELRKNNNNNNQKDNNDLNEENNLNKVKLNSFQYNQRIYELSNLENSSMRRSLDDRLIQEINIHQPKKFEINEKENKLVFDSLYSVKGKLNINYCNFIISCFNLKKNKIYDKIENIFTKLDSKLDVLHYFRNLKNMKILKKLVLEKDQINILKLISNKLYSISTLDEEDKNKKIKNANEFKKIIESIDQTKDINIRLLREIYELKEN
jgi:hypothetical protein